MAIYSTLGRLPIYRAPYIPIIRAKDIDIHITSEPIYVSGGGQSAGDNSSERKALFNQLAPWLKLYPSTWPKLLASSEELVSNSDLAFILDLCQNLKNYYSDTSILYHPVTKDSAFLVETINYVILGYEPSVAQSMALLSIKNEKFISADPWMIELNKLKEETKVKLRNLKDQGSTQTLFGALTDMKTAVGNTTKWLVAGGILLLIARKK